MDPRQQQPKPRLFSSLLLVLVLFAVGLGAWWLSRPGKPAAPAPTAQPETDQAAVPQREPPARAASTAPPPAVAGPARPPEQAAEPELLIVPPGNDDPRPDGGPLHPHPITPRHIRIQHENALIGQLNGAMDVQDGPGLRRLLDEYRRDYPEDPNQLQEGYAVVADCLEHPGPASRAAGQSYYDRERGSILRVFVGRHCLEPRD